MAGKENLWHWMESGEMVVVKLGGWVVGWWQRGKRESEMGKQEEEEIVPYHAG